MECFVFLFKLIASRKCEEILSRYRGLGVFLLWFFPDGPRRKKDEKEEREKEEAAEFEMQLGSETIRSRVHEKKEKQVCWCFRNLTLASWD